MQANPHGASHAPVNAAARDAQTASTGTGRLPHTYLPAGSRLGGFELSDIIGQGGMATVYRATQLSLRRPVAVKILSTAFANDPVSLKRFETEAGALAGLSHPNIVNIIDRGTENGISFYAMELVEGITLDQLIYNVNLDEGHYRHIVSEISKALCYVHERGIVHRDIKPSNVLVTRDGIVKVSDFGIAHWMHEEAPRSRTGRAVGTLNYMAPELADDAGRVDVRADIYALAVTFFKMMARQLPSRPDSSVTSFNPDLPHEVDDVIIRGMHPDPAERFPTIREFCEALLAAFHPVTAPAGDRPAQGAPTEAVPGLAAMVGGEMPDGSSSLVLPPFMFDANDLPTPIGVQRVEREMLEAPEEDRKLSSRTVWILWIVAAVVLGVLLAGGVYFLYFF